MLITVLHFRPKGNWEPRNEVGSLSLDEHLVGLNREPSDSLLQRLNPLDHSSSVSIFAFEQAKADWA